MSARLAARDALVAVLPAVEESLDDDAQKAEYLLDVLAPHMARLLIECGGLVQITKYHDARCDRDGARASCWHHVLEPCGQMHAGRMVDLYCVKGDER